MDKYFQKLVKEDTASAWAELKAQMPFNFSQDGSDLISELGLDPLEIDFEDDDEVEEALADVKPNTIWAEHYLEPILVINDHFAPYVVNCQSISLVENFPGSRDLTGLYLASTEWTDDVSTEAISFLAIACPRCQLKHTQGDEDAEFSPDFGGEWIDQGCLACDGTGEWTYDLL